jgi:epoxyqueuosine reductase
MSEEQMSDEQKTATSLSRRSFLKIAGLVGVAAQAGGLVASGIRAGEDHTTYTGWESFNPGTQFFNRTPFEVPFPKHVPVGEVSRPGIRTDRVFGRVELFESAYNENPNWTIDDPIEDLGVPQELVDHYNEFPDRLEWDFRTFSETIPVNREDRQIYNSYYRLADAYSAGFSAHAQHLPRPQAPPEISDWAAPGADVSDPDNFRRIGAPVPFKSPELASEFIKEMAHRYGATLVGITRMNLDHTYSDGWRGCPEDYNFSRLPETWEYAIVFGVPMEWDVIMASPQFSTSGDAYDRVSTAAVRLEGCIKNLGYAARTHSPNTGYDLVIPPLAIEAGLGEVSRAGYCLTPELGLNFRPAVVTTNMPLAIDNPIEFGVADFCNKCKLCAEYCPPGAISFADSPDGMVIRGYEHWYINNAACYNYWRETMGPMGCRLCVVTCPYTRKNNWVHDLGRTLDSRDPTGLVGSGLLWMEKTFFDPPDVVDYRRPPDGEFASFKHEPFYLQSEKYLDIEVTSPRRGG